LVTAGQQPGPRWARCGLPLRPPGLFQEPRRICRDHSGRCRSDDMPRARWLLATPVLMLITSAARSAGRPRQFMQHDDLELAVPEGAQRGDPGFQVHPAIARMPGGWRRRRSLRRAAIADGAVPAYGPRSVHDRPLQVDARLAGVAQAAPPPLHGGERIPRGSFSQGSVAVQQ
jgi:hypothetical protein